MKNTFKKILLVLCLCLTIIPLSGCGKKKDGISFLNGLEIETKEISLSSETESLLKELTGSKAEKDAHVVSVSITNNTDYYFNGLPVGITWNSSKVDFKTLQEEEIELEGVRLIMKPGDSNTFFASFKFEKGVKDSEINVDNVTLVPLYKIKDDKKPEKTDKDTVTKDDKAQDLDEDFFKKYVTKDASSDVVYPSDVTYGDLTSTGKTEEVDGITAELFSAEITNNTDKDLSKFKVDDNSFFPLNLNDKNEVVDIVGYNGVATDETMVLNPYRMDLDAKKSKKIYATSVGEQQTSIKFIFNGLFISQN